MTTLRAGVVGLGVGERHAEAYFADPRCELAAICDRDPARLASVAERFPEARPVADPGHLLADPTLDVLSIASHDDDHFEQAKLGIEAGKHLFVEKPLCLLREHADELWRLLSARPELKLSSNLPLRRSPRFLELRDAIRRGELGEPYYLEADYEYGRLFKITEGWRGRLETYSVTLGGGVHMVDLLLWLTGAPVVRVQAAGNAIATRDSAFRFDDFVVAILDFEGGAIGKVTANFGSVQPHFHAVKVFGTEGTFVNAIGPATRWSVGPTGPVASEVDAAYPGAHKGASIGAFVDSIVGDGRPDVTAEQAFEALAVCFAIDEAKSTGDAVIPQSFS